MTTNTETFDHNAIDIPGVSAPDDPAARDRWIREQVLEALNDPSPAIPHEKVMAKMAGIIDDAAARRSAPVVAS
ncbi:hypothetical protein AB4Y45_33535 [Paraburkholderia sp. EG287A]|uniref:antitoxin PaaA2 family protein n=1 Tax=Paraburkholderia sp. EG287A TaxID=3237012 RepID=UPI0034D1FD39